MSAIVDGVPWSSDCVDVAIAESSWFQIAGISLRATDGQVGEVSFLQVGSVRTGTFSIDTGTVRIPNGPYYPWSRGGIGTLTITTSTATHIVGTFAFTNGVNPVTNGRFNITFTK